MKEMIEAFRADVERTEAAHLRFITMRTAEARTLLDMLEQTGRAQRTGKESFAHLNEGDFMAIWNELGGDEKWLKNFGYYQYGFAVQDAICDRLAAAPAAGQAGLAKTSRMFPIQSIHYFDAAGTRHELQILSGGPSTFGTEITVAAPVAADTEQATDELSDEEQAALDRLDKPEWRAASNLKLRALLAVEVANCIRMGAKIENLQDELRATEGYRRGYTDGAADAAGIADVQSDWRGIWGEGPLQGEAVLATNGTAVIAARWFATGWAKHDHFSDELEYLPEGWVTHWKPFPPAQDANAQGGK